MNMQELENYIAAKSKKDLTVGTGIHNSWRSMRFTKKGKKVGTSKEWEIYANFRDDMLPTWRSGLILHRIDKSKPFSKENCFWISREDQAFDKGIIIEFNGDKGNFEFWANKTGCSKFSIKNRYHKKYKKGLMTLEETLYGPKLASWNKKPKSAKEVLEKKGDMALQNKASKMFQSYRCKDRERRQETTISKEWLLENILFKNCIYCGTSELVGCERIDNTIGHTIENCVPACFYCNRMRSNKFTFDEMKKIGKFVRENILSERK